MYEGKDTCNQLKAIRKQIADANGIDYSPTECHHDGPCSGTCPKCESEMRYIEQELMHRQSLGKKIVVAGVAVGISSVITTNANSQCINETTPVDSIAETETLLGDIENPELECEVITEKDEDDSDYEQIFLTAEKMPEFPGGPSAMRRYIYENMKFPVIAGKVATGRVFVSFVVDIDGSVKDIKIVRGLDPFCDKEAIRIIESMPKWEPGQQNGKAVKVQYTVPINFTL